MPRPRKVTPSKEAPKEPLPTSEDLFNRAKQIAVDEAYGDAIHTAAGTSKLVSDISALLAKVDSQIGRNAIVILSDLLEIEDASEPEEKPESPGIDLLRDVVKSVLTGLALRYVNGPVSSAAADGYLHYREDHKEDHPLPQTNGCPDCMRDIIKAHIDALSKKPNAYAELNQFVGMLMAAIELANEAIAKCPPPSDECKIEAEKPIGVTTFATESLEPSRIMDLIWATVTKYCENPQKFKCKLELLLGGLKAACSRIESDLSVIEGENRNRQKPTGKTVVTAESPIKE